MKKDIDCDENKILYNAIRLKRRNIKMDIEKQIKQLQGLCKIKNGSLRVNGFSFKAPEGLSHTSQTCISLGQNDETKENLGHLIIEINYIEGNPVDFTLEITSEIDTIFIMECMPFETLEHLRDFLNYAI